MLEARRRDMIVEPRRMGAGLVWFAVAVADGGENKA